MMKTYLSIATVLFGVAVEARPLQYTFNTKLDHINAGGESPEFAMRYLVDDQYFRNTTSGKARPILFYAGNEGDIWNFYENSGFMT